MKYTCFLVLFNFWNYLFVCFIIGTQVCRCRELVNHTSQSIVYCPQQVSTMALSKFFFFLPSSLIYIYYIYTYMIYVHIHDIYIHIYMQKKPHRRVTAIWFDLYEVQKEAKLIFDDRSYALLLVIWVYSFVKFLKFSILNVYAFPCM